MAQERLHALKNPTETLQFFGNEKPKCPHCGEFSDVSENEWWKLFEEGEHDVTCPSCDLDFIVNTLVSYTFSTDEQPER